MTQPKPQMEGTETHPTKTARHHRLGEGHKAFLRLMGKGVVAAEHVGRRAIKAEKKAESAIRRVEEKAREASTRPTSAVQRAAGAARRSYSYAKGLFGSLKLSLRHEGRALKRAIKMAEAERKKETAKQKAVAQFLVQWEKDYELSQKGIPAPTGNEPHTDPGTKH